MKGKDIPAISAIKSRTIIMINRTKKQSMKGKKIHVTTAINKQDGNRILKCTILAA